MKLSVCLLTRNQEGQLVAALRSVARVADEMIVIDTGSHDRTAALAGQFGAKVVAYSWQEDFAAGRNFAVENARGQWVLWLNADEELAPESEKSLLACVERPGVFGYFVHIRHVAQGKAPARTSDTQDLRLFRRRPDLRFVGRLHPVHSPESIAIISGEGLSVMGCDVVLQSTARPWESDDSKLRWMLKLIELELSDRPGQLHYMIEKGRVLLRLADTRGHDAMAQAAERVIPLQSADKPPSSNVQVLLEYLMTAPPSASPHRLTREQARHLARRWFPSSPALLYQAAAQDFQEGHFAAAAETLERLVHLGRTGTYDRSRGFDPTLVGEHALINLGACYERLGRPDQAARCYQSLLHNLAYQARAREGLARINRSRSGG